MPKLKPETQVARRGHILDAAERCFARSGFHRTTMQDICREAEVSAGALYIYFASKEDLISGIAERDRNEFAQRFAMLAAAPDFIQALQGLAEHYFVDEPPHRRLMCVEIGVEATRNPVVAQIHRSVDTFVKKSFEELFTRLEREGRIRPTLDIPTLTEVFFVVGDGLFWRRAVDPAFDGRVVVPAVTRVIAGLINPVNPETTNMHQTIEREGQTT